MVEKVSAQFSPRPSAKLLASDARTLANSGYAFTYTVGTAQLVTARLASVLKSLERLNDSVNLKPKPLFGDLHESSTSQSPALAPSPLLSAPLSRSSSLVNVRGYRKDVSQASEALVKSNRLDTYIDSIHSAFDFSAKETSSNVLPLFPFRDETPSWLKSVERFLKPNTTNDSLLEILAMPYIDVSARRQGRPTLLRRSSSYATLPLVESALDQPDATCEPTPVASVASTNAAKSAVFTTTTVDPYAIRSLNDLACLMFGLTQSKAVGTSMLEFVEQSRHQDVRDALDTDSSIPLSGKLLDIVKGLPQNRTAKIVSTGSFWVERSGNYLVWVIDEIDMRIITTAIDIGGHITLPPPFEHVRHTDDVCPKLLAHPPNQVCHSTIPAFDRQIPVLYTHTGQDLTLRFPYVVGTAIVLDTHHNILATNECSLFTMLGIHGGTLEGQHISSIIPKFSVHMEAISKTVALKLTPGMVIPEHMFRQVACKDRDDFFQEYPENGVVALTASGKNLYVDIELRILSPHIQVLWATFARPTFESNFGCMVPSQLDLMRTKSVTSDSSTSALSSPRSGLAVSIPSTPSAVTPESTTPVKPAAGLQSPPAVAEPALPPAPSAAPHAPAAAAVTKVGARRRELKMSDFIIDRTLGEGAYGRVVLAAPTSDPANVLVIKSIFKDRILVDTWTRDRQLGTIPNEIKILNELREKPHRNIICLIDYFEDTKHFHIETKLHGNPAIDLFDYIENEEDLPIEECKRMFTQIVSAISHLHQLGIVHRDIKDENIIVDTRGVCQLIDFGSAAYIRKGPFDVFVGTVDYAAPEVLEGNPFEGPPQDVWALGVLLYTMMYKENPFSNVDEILSAELDIPHDLDPDLTNLLHAILVPNFRTRPKVDWVLDQLESERS